jgi:hypothetical protein
MTLQSTFTHGTVHPNHSELPNVEYHIQIENLSPLTNCYKN